MLSSGQIVILQYKMVPKGFIGFLPGVLSSGQIVVLKLRMVFSKEAIRGPQNIYGLAKYVTVPLTILYSILPMWGFTY